MPIQGSHPQHPPTLQPTNHPPRLTHCLGSGALPQTTYYNAFWSSLALPLCVVLCVAGVLWLRYRCVLHLYPPERRAKVLGDYATVRLASKQLSRDRKAPKGSPSSDTSSTIAGAGAGGSAGDGGSGNEPSKSSQAGKPDDHLVGVESEAAAAGAAAVTAKASAGVQEPHAIAPKVIRSKYTGLTKTSIVVLLFLIYVRVSKTMLQLFDVYTTRIYGRFLLRADLRVSVGTAAYGVAAVAAIIGLIGFTVGLPVYSVLLLRHNRHKLHTEHVRRRFGFLYDGYKPQFYAWESIVVSRKLMVVCIASFVRDPFMQVTITRVDFIRVAV